MEKIYDLLKNVLGNADLDGDDMYATYKSYTVEDFPLTKSLKEGYEEIILFAYPYLKTLYRDAEFYIRSIEFDENGLMLKIDECEKTVVYCLHDLLKTQKEKDKLKEIYRNLHVNFVRRDKQILSNNLPVSSFNFEKQIATCGFANFSEFEYIRIKTFLHDLDLTLTESRILCVR